LSAFLKAAARTGPLAGWVIPGLVAQRNKGTLNVGSSVYAGVGARTQAEHPEGPTRVGQTLEKRAVVVRVMGVIFKS